MNEEIIYYLLQIMVQEIHTIHLCDDLEILQMYMHKSDLVYVIIFIAPFNDEPVVFCTIVYLWRTVLSASAASALKTNPTVF